MSNLAGLEQDAVHFANQAVGCDQQGLVADAIFYYCVRKCDYKIIIM